MEIGETELKLVEKVTYYDILIEVSDGNGEDDGEGWVFAEFEITEKEIAGGYWEYSDPVMRNKDEIEDMFDFTDEEYEQLAERAKEIFLNDHNA